MKDIMKLSDITKNDIIHMTTIHIRQLQIDDVHDFRTIRLSALKHSPEMFGSTYKVESKRPLSIFTELISNSVIFGAYEDNRIIGIIIFQQQVGLKDRHKAHLYSFFVEPNFRNQGIAQQLLQTVIDYGQHHVEQIMLSVVADNISAIRLYTKNGFRSYGIEPHAMKSELGYQDENLMVLFYSQR